MKLLRPILLSLITVMVSPVVMAAKSPSVDEWMDETLIPAVIAQFSSHPRFEADVVRFVAMENGQPSAISNELVLALRDKLQEVVVDRTDVRVAWQVNRENFSRESEMQRVDCTASDVHYYIGIEVSEVRRGTHEISIRALDLEDQNWVAGFGGVWSGNLSAMQLMAFRHPATDDAFLGQRIVPFEESQTDLLAAQLAHELGCSLLREMSGEYVASAVDSEDDQLAEILELVSNNIAPYRAIQITSSSSAGNSKIATSAHVVDDDLYQYWITVTPTDPESDMPAVSASAYIFRPEKFLDATLASTEKTAGLNNKATLISSLDVVQLRSSSQCALPAGQRYYETASRTAPQSCYALRAKPSEDVVMFFLYHQLNNGLVRLGGKRCDSRSNVSIARRGEAESVPLLMDVSGSASWLPNDDWMMNPDEDTFYAVASSDTKAARALASHFEKLPQRCGRSLRPGLDGAALRAWFRELDDIADNWSTQVDWRSVRIRTVY